MMGLDQEGASTTRDHRPLGRWYVDGAAPPLQDQVAEIEVASPGLQESLTPAQQGGGLMHAQFGVPWVQVARSPVSQLTEL